ncbi:hypothetical protein QQ045_009386 [Rhodiola kirilowii]
MDASHITIMEKELELERLQESILKKELELLKAKANKSGFPAPLITANDLKRAKIEDKKSEATNQGVNPPKVYAIMNGPRKGIYTTYPEVGERDILKEFPTEFEAKYVLSTYLGPQPKNDYKEAMLSIAKPKNHFQVIGHVPQNTAPMGIMQPIVRKDCSDLLESDFLSTYNHFLQGKCEQGIYPIIRTGLLKLMIYPEAKPQRVYELFCLGLIDTIYLGQNYKELEHFNSSIKQTVLQFVKKTQTDKQIYLKFQSSYADFNEQGKIILPYHWIRMGPAGIRQAITQLKANPVICKEDLIKLRVLTLGNIAYELFKVKDSSDLKINYCSPQVIIHSHFNKPINPRELEAVKGWKKLFEEATFNPLCKTNSAGIIVVIE